MARIAAIDDDPAFLAMLHDLLQSEGWEMFGLHESDQAFEEVQQSRPDLVILDLRMDTPGWHILTRLKQDPATRHIPVIVCSAVLHELDGQGGWLEEHDVGVLPKPFEIDDLYGCVRAALQTERPS